LPSSLTLSCSRSETGLTDGGSLSPAIGGTTISIVYTAPSGSTTTHDATTSDSGSYSDSFSLHGAGVWHVQAHWAGDDQHLPSDSSVCTITVGGK